MKKQGATMDVDLKKVLVDELNCCKEFVKRMEDLQILSVSSLLFLMLDDDNSQEPDVADLLNVFHDEEKDTMDQKTNFHTFKDELLALHNFGFHVKHFVLPLLEDEDSFNFDSHFDAHDFKLMCQIKQQGHESMFKDGLGAFIIEFYPEQAAVHWTQAATSKMDPDDHSGEGLALAPSDPKFAFLLKPRRNLKGSKGPGPPSAPKESITKALAAPSRPDSDDDAHTDARLVLCSSDFTKETRSSAKPSADPRSSMAPSETVLQKLANLDASPQPFRRIARDPPGNQELCKNPCPNTRDPPSSMAPRDPPGMFAPNGAPQQPHLSTEEPSEPQGTPDTPPMTPTVHSHSIVATSASSNLLQKLRGVVKKLERSHADAKEPNRSHVNSKHVFDKNVDKWDVGVVFPLVRAPRHSMKLPVANAFLDFGLRKLQQGWTMPKSCKNHRNNAGVSTGNRQPNLTFSKVIIKALHSAVLPVSLKDKDCIISTNQEISCPRVSSHVKSIATHIHPTGFELPKHPKDNVKGPASMATFKFQAMNQCLSTSHFLCLHIDPILVQCIPNETWSQLIKNRHLIARKLLELGSHDPRSNKGEKGEVTWHFDLSTVSNKWLNPRAKPRNSASLTKKLSGLKDPMTGASSSETNLMQLLAPSKGLQQSCKDWHGLMDHAQVSSTQWGLDLFTNGHAVTCGKSVNGSKDKICFTSMKDIKNNGETPQQVQDFACKVVHWQKSIADACNNLKSHHQGTRNGILIYLSKTDPMGIHEWISRPTVAPELKASIIWKTGGLELPMTLPKVLMDSLRDPKFDESRVWKPGENVSTDPPFQELQDPPLPAMGPSLDPVDQDWHVPPPEAAPNIVKSKQANHKFVEIPPKLRAKSLLRFVVVFALTVASNVITARLTRMNLETPLRFRPASGAPGNFSGHHKALEPVAFMSETMQETDVPMGTPCTPMDTPNDARTICNTQDQLQGTGKDLLDTGEVSRDTRRNMVAFLRVTKNRCFARLKETENHLSVEAFCSHLPESDASIFLAVWKDRECFDCDQEHHSVVSVVTTRSMQNRAPTCMNISENEESKIWKPGECESTTIMSKDQVLSQVTKTVFISDSRTPDDACEPECSLCNTWIARATSSVCEKNFIEVISLFDLPRPFKQPAAASTEDKTSPIFQD